MIHILCNNGFFWEPFGFLISEHYDVFFTVNINREMPSRWTKWKVRERLGKSLRSWLHYEQSSSIYDVFLLHVFSDRNTCRLLHHSGWNLPFQKTLLTLSKVPWKETEYDHSAFFYLLPLLLLKSRFVWQNILSLQLQDSAFLLVPCVWKQHLHRCK